MIVTIKIKPLPVDVILLDDALECKTHESYFMTQSSRKVNLCALNEVKYVMSKIYVPTNRVMQLAS